jgi:hypothetical protein
VKDPVGDFYFAPNGQLTVVTGDNIGVGTWTRSFSPPDQPVRSLVIVVSKGTQVEYVEMELDFAQDYNSAEMSRRIIGEKVTLEYVDGLTEPTKN